MSQKISQEAHTFYFVYAMLLASRKYMQDLVVSKHVSFSLKRDFALVINRITDLDKKSKASLDKTERDTWHREWTERDYEVFASVFSLMNDMPEEKRLLLEEFAVELSKGNVTMEVKTELVLAE